LAALATSATKIAAMVIKLIPSLRITSPQLAAATTPWRDGRRGRGGK